MSVLTRNDVHTHTLICIRAFPEQVHGCIVHMNNLLPCTVSEVSNQAPWMMSRHKTADEPPGDQSTNRLRACEHIVPYRLSCTKRREFDNRSCLGVLFGCHATSFASTESLVFPKSCACLRPCYRPTCCGCPICQCADASNSKPALLLLLLESVL